MPSNLLHAALPYPVRGARFTVDLAFFDADGALVDAAGTSAETSVDGAAATIASGTPPINVTGMGSYLTVDGRETNCSLLKVKVTASNALTAYVALHPHVLPVLYTGVATAGSSTTLTLASSAPAADNTLVGAILKTTGAPGGGGFGGINNQARRIMGYVGATRVATVSPAWEALPTTAPVLPDNLTTYEVLQTEMMGGSSSGGGLTAPQVAAAVWDALTSSHAIANSMGLKLGTFAFTGTNVHSHVQAGTFEATLDAATLDAIADAVIPDFARVRFVKSCAAAVLVTNCGGGDTGVLTCNTDPLASAANWKNRLLTFATDTPTVALQGWQSVIQAGGSTGSIPIAPPLPVAASVTDMAVIT